MKLLLHIFGGLSPGAALAFINTDAGWNAIPTIETVSQDFVLNEHKNTVSVAPSIGAVHELFAPELARVFKRQIVVLDRVLPNFISTSTKQPPPGDTWASLKPSRPTLYPSDSRFRELPPGDATLLVEFYDALDEINDTLESWIDKHPTTDFNAWNVLMHRAQNNLKVGERAIQRFCPDRSFDKASPAAGTLLDQSRRALRAAETARSAHMTRATQGDPPKPQRR